MEAWHRFVQQAASAADVSPLLLLLLPAAHTAAAAESGCARMGPSPTLPTRSKVRVFRFSTGKLSRTYDESLAAANELQRSGSGELRQPCKGAASAAAALGVVLACTWLARLPAAPAAALGPPVP